MSDTFDIWRGLVDDHVWKWTHVRVNDIVSETELREWYDDDVDCAGAAEMALAGTGVVRPDPDPPE